MIQIEFRFLLPNDRYEALSEDLLSNIRDYIFECVKSDVAIDINQVPNWFNEYVATTPRDVDLEIPY